MNAIITTTEKIDTTDIINYTLPQGGTTNLPVNLCDMSGIELREVPGMGLIPIYKKAYLKGGGASRVPAMKWFTARGMDKDKAKKVIRKWRSIMSQYAIGLAKAADYIDLTESGKGLVSLKLKHEKPLKEKGVKLNKGDKKTAQAMQKGGLDLPAIARCVGLLKGGYPEETILPLVNEYLNPSIDIK